MENNLKKTSNFSNDEICKIKSFASNLPVKPDNIKIGRTGNIILEYNPVVYLHPGNGYLDAIKQFHYTISIAKPAKYCGGFKLMMTYHDNSCVLRGYEYPGKKVTNKNGELLLPTIESVFKLIDKQWEKHNLTAEYSRGYVFEDMIENAQKRQKNNY